MSEQSEEEARRRKIIADLGTLDLAAQNIRGALAGKFTVDQLNELTEIDREYQRKTLACMAGSDDDTEEFLPDSPGNA